MALTDLADLAQRVQARLDAQTKPPGSLGRIEALALQLALACGSETPQLAAPQLVVCAADHGIAAQGVSAYPQAVTAQMLVTMLAGGAAVSVLARQHGLALTLVDCGVAADLAPQPGLVIAKVCRGSADSSVGPALTGTQVDAALANGAAVVRALPGNVLLLGEMGIANTSAAALLMCRLAQLPIADCIGRGTGLDDAGLARKHAVLERTLQRHAGASGPHALLAAFGGAEIATLCGAVLQAADERRVVVVDGFITTAAVALAAAISPAVLRSCVFSHASAESGHARWLQALGATPLLDLQLRLGEGSGAALAWPLLQSAALLLAQMATFDVAGVSRRVA